MLRPFPPLLVLVLLAGTGCNSQEASPTSGGSVVNTPAGTEVPLLTSQWHLKNTGQRGRGSSVATAGEDINVFPVWESCGVALSCRGEGVRIAVVDDGLEATHPNLAPNVVPGGSKNYTSNGQGATNPTNVATDRDSGHGTSVAGIIAASALQSTELRGVAPGASLVGYNYLLNTTDTNEADAMVHNKNVVSVSNNSWGPSDGTGRLAPATSTWKTAIADGVTNGRLGRGIVYVWAAGNGGAASFRDNSNYDGYANHRNVIAVGAVNAQGRRSSYSERGANILVAAPGGEFCSSLAITTVDRVGNVGLNTNSTAGGDELSNTSYTRCMNGTSAATPVVAGVVALMLQANPLLTWRDVRWILAHTARKNHPTDSGWVSKNAGTLNLNHSFGYGVVDAAAAVTMSATFAGLPEARTFSSAISTPNLAIPDNNTTGVSDTITVGASDVTTVEFVEVVFNATHTYSGDLEVILEAPNGVQSVLAEQHYCASNACSPYTGWVFGSVRHLADNATGNWRLIVRDRDAQISGFFQSWQLRLYGH